MKALRIIGTKNTPEITFDPGKSKFEIMGTSCSEDAKEFYSPVLKWLDEFKESDYVSMPLDFKLIYFNTASAKLLLFLIQKLQKIHDGGKEVLVRWYFPDEDEDLQEAGQDYADIVQVPFEFIPYTPDY